MLGAGKPMEVDSAALTGESLPQVKYPNDQVLMGSVIVRGKSEKERKRARDAARRRATPRDAARRRLAFAARGRDRARALPRGG